MGWVYTPKTIEIRPGLTVLNAVSEAGGTLFAADSQQDQNPSPGPGTRRPKPSW